MRGNRRERGSTARGLGMGATVAAALIAVIVPSAAALETRSKSTTIDVFPDTGSATAKCRQGSEAVSGGFDNPNFDAPPGPAVFTFDSRRTGERKWKGSGANNGNTAEYEVFAYCDKSEPGLKAKSKSRTVDPKEARSLTVKCKKGSEAVSGGFAAPSFNSSTGPTVHTYESRRKGERRWVVSAYNYADVEPGELTGFVYCDKSEPGLRTKWKSTTIAGGNDFNTPDDNPKPRCRKGREAVAGGFDNPDFDPTFQSGGTGPAIFAYASKRKGHRKWTGAGFNDGDGSGTFKTFVYCEKK